MNRSAKLRLYKDILRAAKTFPSIKRDKIAREIRATFRDNAKLENTEEIEKALAVATKGLSQLNMYSNLRLNKSPNWSITLEQNPMPRREKS